MRIVFKILVVLGVVVGIANYVIYLQTGRMPVQEWVKNISLNPGDMASEAKNLGKNVIDQVKPSEPLKVYKWTDENGVVHYGERPANEAAQEVSIDTDHNVVSGPAPGVPAGETTDPVQDQQAPLEKAKAAAEAMKARIKEQETY